MPNRGGINRRTGKTTPRNKAKTHWGGGMKRSATSAKAKPAKAGAATASKK